MLVLRAAGTNCDAETAWAFERAGGLAERLHVNAVAERPETLGRFSILALPGGFSYGDDISAGRILAQLLETRLLEPVRRFIERGGLVIGICNGFQVLVKTALLPGRLDGPCGAAREGEAGDVARGTGPGRVVTLAHNAPGAHNRQGGFLCRWVDVEEVPGSRCVWTKGVGRMALPIAHGEGRVAVAGPWVTESLVRSGRVALAYAGGERGGGLGMGVDLPGGNPNGSAGAEAGLAGGVAGLCDETGRVLGLMPHPERHVRACQHPAWATLGWEALADGAGLAVFRNGVRAARGS